MWIPICKSFSKRDWERHWEQIIEQIDADLIIGIRKLYIDIEDWVVNVVEVKDNCTLKKN